MRRRSASRVVAMPPAGSRLRLRASLLPVAAGCAAVIPLLSGLSPAAAGVGAVVAIWIVLVDGYTVTYGFAGQFSVGHAALWGVGAYATAILMARLGWSFWSAIPVAVVAGCLAGAVFGLPAWRLRGDYIALVTLAGGIIVEQIMLNWSVTGGAAGIANIPPVSIGDRPLTDTGYYLLLGAIALLCTVFTSYLKHSAIGLSWRAVKDDELAAEASGIRVTRAKILGFVVGGGFAGLSGGLYAVFNGFVSSVSFGVEQSVLVILMVLLGGVGRVWGSALAAALLTWLTAELTTVSSVSVGIIGFLMLAAIMFRVRYGGWREEVR
jgi:branched-chain amino acid transport system permease protein